MIKIGDVSIPTNEFAIAGTALLGIRKSGKTYGAKGIAEQLMEQHIPIIVFDAIGSWRHLRTPGAGGGFPVVVAGGEDGDIHLSPQNVSELVRAAMRSNINLVIDLYSPKLSKSDWRKIVQNGFHTLLYENKKYGHRYIILEEAAEYIPQRINDGETYAAVEKVGRMGGNVGLGLMIINQRSQEVNKSVLDLCDNLVLMRQRGSNAIDSVEKWMERVDKDTAKKISLSLPNLSAGECWVWAESSEIPQRTKTARIKSFHPDRTKQSESVKARKSIDTSEFIAKMWQELPKLEAEKKDSDPSELKKRIRELEMQLKNQKPSEPEKVPALDNTEADRLNALIESYDRIGGGLSTMSSELEDAKRSIDTMRAETTFFRLLLQERLKPKPMNPVASLSPSANNRQWTKKSLDEQYHKEISKFNGATNKEISGGLKRMMIALAQRPGLNRRQLGVRSGLSSGSGTFQTYLSKAKTSGWLIEENGAFHLSDNGRLELGDFTPLPEGRGLLSHWLNSSMLGGGAKRILESLAAVYPESMTREELGVAAGISYSSGTFQTYLSKLNTLELVDSQRSGIKASEEFFQ
jgi:uncharacterized protein